MAKPTKYATTICLGLSALALLGIILGLINHSPVIVLSFLIPVVIYEIYRTEGESTRWASWAMIIVIGLEIYFLWRNISFDLSRYFNTTAQYVGGFWVPLGDIKVVGPLAMAIISVILFFRTNGKYTKWLAIIIFVSALAIIYLLDSNILKTLIPGLIQRGFNQVYY